MRVVSFGPSSSSPESLLPPRFQPSRSHLLLSRFKALSRYAFNTLFPKRLFPWQSFRISFVSRATLSLPLVFVPRRNSFVPRHSRTRHGGLVSLLCVFFTYTFFALLYPDSSPFDNVQSMRMACDIKFVQYTRTK